MATMNFQVEKALKLMARNEAVNRADLSEIGIGDRTIAVLMENGWITLSQSMTGSPLYSITASGREKTKEPIPSKPAKRKPLRSLEPRIPTLQPRLK